MKESLWDQAARRDVGLDNSRGYPNMEYNCIVLWEIHNLNAASG